MSSARAYGDVCGDTRQMNRVRRHTSGCHFDLFSGAVSCLPACLPSLQNGAAGVRTYETLSEDSRPGALATGTISFDVLIDQLLTSTTALQSSPCTLISSIHSSPPPSLRVPRPRQGYIRQPELVDHDQLGGKSPNKVLCFRRPETRS